jgi:hypothetical protein
MTEQQVRDTIVMPCGPLVVRESAEQFHVMCACGAVTGHVPRELPVDARLDQHRLVNLRRQMLMVTHR